VSKLKGLGNDTMLFRFSLYGFLKNLRFFEPFLILFFRDAGLSFFQIGVLYAVRDISTNLFETPSGLLADVFGRRRTMVLSFSGYILSFLIFYAVPGFPTYLLAMLVFGFGEAFRTGTHKALILEHLRLNEKTHLKVPYYGRTRAASQLGAALNSLLAAALVFLTGNYRYIFLASIVPYVLDLINLATYPRRLDGELNTLQWGEIPRQMKATTLGFFRIFRRPQAVRAILNSSGFDAFFKATKDYLQPILEALALGLPILVALDGDQRSALVIGVVYCGIYLLNSYASREAGTIGAMFGDVNRAIDVTFFIGAGLLVAAGISSWGQLPVISIVIFLGLHVLHNVRKPLNVANISDQINKEVMASGLSAESQVVTLLAAIIAPLLGALADVFGVGTALTSMGGLMAIVALVTRVSLPAVTAMPGIGEEVQD
jgi:MFS family permease